MPTKQKGANRKSADRGAKSKRAARLKDFGQSSSQIVKDAARLLDEEIASGIVAAKVVQQRFQKERRINPGDFKDTLTKFQSDAHEVVNQLNEQFSAMGSKESADLATRFTTNTHSLIDLFVELVNTGAEVADQLAQSNLSQKREAGDGPRRS